MRISSELRRDLILHRFYSNTMALYPLIKEELHKTVVIDVDGDVEIGIDLTFEGRIWTCLLLQTDVGADGSGRSGGSVGAWIISDRRWGRGVFQMRELLVEELRARGKLL